ncbi:unnamed protein product [Ambrosiozyma monospora]|uniref:Unnamed protein product n=1 Tax=Ambrosiozyma monospora TaxID=43982 RepID=A0A9W6T800_AMBMO|nr:unnamed protein product [Ambrosiozyma monospora]
MQLLKIKTESSIQTHLKNGTICVEKLNDDLKKLEVAGEKLVVDEQRKPRGFLTCVEPGLRVRHFIINLKNFEQASKVVEEELKTQHNGTDHQATVMIRSRDLSTQLKLTSLNCDREATVTKNVLNQRFDVIFCQEPGLSNYQPIEHPDYKESKHEVPRGRESFCST